MRLYQHLLLPDNLYKNYRLETFLQNFITEDIKAHLTLSSPICNICLLLSSLLIVSTSPNSKAFSKILASGFSTPNLLLNKMKLKYRRMFNEEKILSSNKF